MSVPTPFKTAAENCSHLEKSINYSFRNQIVLLEALTHRSALSEQDQQMWNERLEFLGDSVLGLGISRRLMQVYPDWQEGDLSRKRAGIVNEAALAEIARSIDLGKYVVVGKGELKTGGPDRDSLLADTLEAVIGAVFVDGGYRASDKLIGQLFDKAISTGEAIQQDYKTILQEWSQDVLRLTPKYKVLKASGPDHEKEFRVAVLIGEIEFTTGSGASKKRASQDAAQIALEALGKKSMINELKKKLGIPTVKKKAVSKKTGKKKRKKRSTKNVTRKTGES